MRTLRPRTLREMVGVGQGESGVLREAKSDTETSVITKQLVRVADQLYAHWNDVYVAHETMMHTRERYNQPLIGNGWEQEQEDAYQNLAQVINRIFDYMLEAQNGMRKVGDWVSETTSEVLVLGEKHDTQIVITDDGRIAYKNGDNVQIAVDPARYVGTGAGPLALLGTLSPWALGAIIVAGIVMIGVVAWGSMEAIKKICDTAREYIKARQIKDAQDFQNEQIKLGATPEQAAKNSAAIQNGVNAQIAAETERAKAENKFSEAIASAIYGLLGITIVGGIIYAMASFGPALIAKRRASRDEEQEPRALLPAAANPTRRCPCRRGRK